MLPIILTILKIAGILLLLLLLLAVCLIFAVLFVPLRYRLMAVHTQEKTHGEFRVTWLLHLISLRVLFQPPAGELIFNRDTLQWKVRVMGLDPAGIASFFNKTKKKNRGKRREAPDLKTTSEKKAPQKEYTLQNKDTLDNNTISESRNKRGSTDTSLNKENKRGSTDTSGNKKNKPEGTDIPENMNKPDKKETGKKTSAKSRKDRFFTRFRELCTGLRKRIQGFCAAIKRIPKRLRSLKRKIVKILKTPGELSRRVSEFRSRLEACDAEEVVRETLSRLKEMLRHFGIRKGKGYIRFGTGDPALTGEITGVLYLLLPTSCGEISLDPQFTETMFETELDISGHIRLVHAVTFIWWAFRNRKLRRLIQIFRTGR